MLRKDFIENPKFVATRDGFGKALLELGRENEAIVALCADLTDSVKMTEFRDMYKDRFFELGVAEQNMAGVASGLASMGLIPYMASYAMFSPGRNWEQIRTTICYNNVPVKIVGAHAGLSVGPDGATHQAIEDIAIMQVLPNMEVYAPIDDIQAYAITKYVANTGKPAYFRLNREKSIRFYDENYIFNPNYIELISLGDINNMFRTVVFTYGPIAYEVYKAIDILKNQGIEISIFNISRIKPLNKNEILRIVKDYKNVVVVEEHQKIGGLGSVITQLLGEHLIKKVLCIGIEDRFGQSGKPDELYIEYGLDSGSIANKIFNFVNL